MGRDMRKKGAWNKRGTREGKKTIFDKRYQVVRR